MAEELTPEQAEEKRKLGELATKWLSAIRKRRTKEKSWRDQAEKVLKRYRDERDTDTNAAKFAILWANTEVMKPAIFSRMPVPDVRRRFLTKDPVARTAAMVMERVLSFTMDTQDFRDTLDRVLEDYLLPGRAQAVVTYKPYIGEKRQPVEPLPPDDENAEERYPEGTLMDEQGGYKMVESKLYEEVRIRYQPWRHYVFGSAVQREGVPWEAYGETLTRDDVHERWPKFERYEELPYSAELTDREEKDQGGMTGSDLEHKCLIWSVWDKASRKVVVVCEGYNDSPLDVTDDPLSLEDFFPAPEPMYSLRTNSNDLPKPEFLMYQDQADELDILCARQRALASALKYRGVYDKQLDELAKISDLVRAGDNTFFPVANFAQLAEKGGLEALLDTLPIEEIQKVLEWIGERMIILKGEIQEIYGISDISRGDTDPNETLGAQQLKAQYTGMRVSTRQERFARFIRDILRKAGEVIVEHFSPGTLRIMSGIKVLPDQEYMMAKQQHQLDAGAVSETEFQSACALLKSDKLRGFKIDIETDSTVPVDKSQEQQNRVQFMEAVGQYLQGVIPAVESGAIPIKMAREGLLFVVRGFKVGTELEETLEELGQDQDEAQQLMQMKQTLAQTQEQLGELQKENTALKSDAQTKMQESAVKQQIDKAEAANKMQIDQATAANDAMIKEREAAHSRQLEQQASQHAEQIKGLSAQHDAQIKERDARADMDRKARDEFAQATTATAGEGNKRLDALIEGQQAQTKAMEAIAANQTAQTEALMALVQQMSKPRNRKGVAMLPSGPIEMHMTEQ